MTNAATSNSELSVSFPPGRDTSDPLRAAALLVHDRVQEIEIELREKEFPIERLDVISRLVGPDDAYYAWIAQYLPEFNWENGGEPVFVRAVLPDSAEYYDLTTPVLDALSEIADENGLVCLPVQSHPGADDTPFREITLYTVFYSKVDAERLGL